MSHNGFSQSSERLHEIAARLVALARELGADACEAQASEGFGLTASVRKGEVDTLEHNRDKGVGITVYLGQCRGHASSSDFSDAALRSTVEAALSIARFTAPDPAAGLPDEALLARDWADPRLHYPWALTVEDAIALAHRCEQAAWDAGAQISNSEGASVSTQQARFVLANSLGFVGGYPSSRHSVSCSVIAGKGDAMQREHWYDSRRDATDLDTVESIGRRAGERAIRRLGACKINTCEVPVLFEAPVAVTLLGNFTHAVSGGALYRRSSFLLDSLGEQVFSPVVSIAERPFDPKVFGASPFDGEGVATRERDVVSAGVLEGYFLSSYSARKLGMQTTGNAGGSHHLVMRGGDESFDALLRRMGRGLVVTELLGQGVNYVTGDYSRGAAGYWVEDGEIRHAVEEVTIAGNLRDMFRGIVAVGDDALARGAKRCGSVLIDRMKVAGS